MNLENNDQRMSAVMKLALEYNAGIVALCTAYQCNMDEYQYKKFIREYRKMNKTYEKRLTEVFQDDIS